mmetsp:Transcript_13411/g.26468  ORF Transcript_13411/g.26468 Transcript_13411/m.26468 type:complete len:318 (+) Transcript_13411:105-1058(+)
MEGHCALDDCLAHHTLHPPVRHSRHLRAPAVVGLVVGPLGAAPGRLDRDAAAGAAAPVGIPAYAVHIHPHILHPRGVPPLPHRVPHHAGDPGPHQRHLPAGHDRRQQVQGRDAGTQRNDSRDGLQRRGARPRRHVHTPDPRVPHLLLGRDPHRVQRHRRRPGQLGGRRYRPVAAQRGRPQRARLSGRAHDSGERRPDGERAPPLPVRLHPARVGGTICPKRPQSGDHSGGGRLRRESSPTVHVASCRVLQHRRLRCWPHARGLCAARAGACGLSGSTRASCSISGAWVAIYPAVCAAYPLFQGTAGAFKVAFGPFWC